MAGTGSFMNFSDIISDHIMGGNVVFFQESEPAVEYFFDGAEGIEFWRYDHRTDDLEQFAFTMSHYVANNWSSRPLGAFTAHRAGIPT